MATYNPVAKASFSSTPFSYQALLSDGDDVVSRSGTVASGIGILKRGAILKADPATGAITVPVAAADCNCILADDVDATSAAAAALVYVSGKFKADAVVWPGALGHGLVADALRDFGIFLESVVYIDGTLVKTAPLEAEAQAAQAVVDANRSELEESRKGGGKAAPEEEAKPKMDSPWAYLTAEEREKNPELAEVPTTEELAGAMPDVPSVTISPTSANVAATGGNGSIAVTITAPGASGTWTVDKDSTATWLTYTPTAPQSANGTITYTATANTGAARVGRFYINGKTFTVNQSGLTGF
jgi:Bacteriophage lambda head decoration protein D/Putative binding domain, N-terminal